MVEEVAAKGADVIVLPELFRYPYPAQTMGPAGFDRAETVDGELISSCRRVAQRLGVVLVASFFERRGPGIGANSAAVIGTTGEILGVYRKAHIPEDPLFYEKFYFMPGEEPCLVVDTPFGRLGVLICWDQWFPEAARLAALQGAEVLVYPTAIATIEEEGPEEHGRQQDAWRTVMRAHAISNGIFVAAVNRVGREGELDFWGRSFIAGPQGELLADLEEGADSSAVVELPLARVAEVRRMWPFFRDRRVDLYGGVMKKWGK
ncbi:MAG: N-carbamoylputrescine amidase [Bradymonadia bacterium]